MAEYVCELVERPAEAPIMVLARRERIVRCRDCAHFLDGDCLLLRVSMPDMDGGFCSWGERRYE